VKRAADYPEGPYVALDLELDSFHHVVREQIGLRGLQQMRPVD